MKNQFFHDGFAEILIAKAHKEGKKAWKKRHGPETKQNHRQS
jgi:hypothetical protein